MATAQMDTVIRHLRRVVLLQEGADRTDGELLASFIDVKDEVAFEALMRRHGPMVLAVCRRVVCNLHDAEDAFQATFLVLARKASSIKPRGMVANWLHGVAFRTAMKARTMTAKRHAREKQTKDTPEPAATEQNQWHDVQALLDQELNGLPENYRLPILLCDLEGKTIKDATHQLGWPQGTLAGRLARGRKLLAKRLANRGVVLSAGSLAAIVSQNVASAGVPTSLMVSTVKAATLIAAGQSTVAGVVSAKVAALMEGVLKVMLLTKLKIATAVVLLGITLLGAGLAGLKCLAQAPGPAKVEQTEPGKDKKADKPKTKAWKERVALPPQPDQVLGVAYSAEMVAVHSNDGGVKLWDAATGKERHSAVHRHNGKIGWLAFSPDGRYLYSSSQGDDRLTILIMDTATGLSKDEVEAVGNDVLMVFAGKGEVWAHGDGNFVKLRKNLFQGNFVVELTTLKGHQDQVRAAAFSMDDKTVVTGADDKTVRLWDVETGKEKATFAGHAEPVVFVASGPAGKILASVSTDGVFKLWDATAKKEIRTPKDQKAVRCAAFSPDGKLVAVGGDGGIVMVLDAATGEERARLRGHKDSVRALAFSPDSRTIISGSQDKTAKLWQLED